MSNRTNELLAEIEKNRAQAFTLHKAALISAANHMLTMFVPSELKDEVGVAVQAMEDDDVVLHYHVTSDGADSWESDGSFDFVFTDRCDEREVEIFVYWDRDDNKRFVEIVSKIAQYIGVRRVIHTEVAGDDGEGIRPTLDGWMDYLETRSTPTHYVNVYAYEVPLW